VEDSKLAPSLAAERMPAQSDTVVKPEGGDLARSKSLKDGTEVGAKLARRVGAARGK